MRHGAYVFFNHNRVKYKGRISIQDNIVYLCQNIISSATCAEHFGHENALSFGRARSQQVKDYVDVYDVTFVTKTAWMKYRDPLIKKVFGFSVKKEGTAKDARYIFGCGAVTLTRSQIREFIEKRDEYFKVKKKMDELEKQLTAEVAKVNNWRSMYEGASMVISSLKLRNLKPENVDLDKLRRIFK